MIYPEVEGKYKLLGFESSKNKLLANIMVRSTSKVISVQLSVLLKSEIVDDLSKNEMKSIYRRYYSKDYTSGVYEMQDRHEKSWTIYVALNIILFAVYVFSSIAATKPVYIEQLDIIVTPGTLLYPLTFLVVDLLNECYGLRLAKRAILFAFTGNGLIVGFLYATTYLPGLHDWKLSVPYDEVIRQVSSVMVASSISFICSEYINSHLICKIKAMTGSRFLFVRVFLSTLFAVIVDSIMFCFIAFYGLMENGEILAMIYVQIAIKVFLALFNIMPTYWARSLINKYSVV